MNLISQDTFVVRLPVFPLNKLPKNEQETRIAFVEAINNPAFLEAIFLASPQLYERVQKYKLGLMESEKDQAKLYYSVLKYYIRMSSRCTPFGLFAGCALGKLSDRTSLVVDKSQGYGVASTRLDMNLIISIVNHLEQNTDVKNKLKFFPNTSIYNAVDKFRYVENVFENGKRQHRIVSIEYEDFLEEMFLSAREGASIIDLAKPLVQDDATFEDALNYVNVLIENQILVSELTPPVTSNDALLHVISKITGIKSVSHFCEMLEEIHLGLENIKNKREGEILPCLFELIEKIDRLGVNYEKSKVFQTDLFIQMEECEVSLSIAKDVLRSFELVKKLSRKNKKTRLNDFSEKFYDRYETKQVPLSTALDPDLGVGYSFQYDSNSLESDLIDGLKLSDNKNKTDEVTLGHSDLFFLKKFSECIKKGDVEIEVTDDDVKDFSEETSPPSILTVCLELAKESVFVEYWPGASGANIAGRFSHIDGELYNHTKKLIDSEKVNDDEIVAEIVHLPESKVANVVFRPEFLDYEIAYLSNSSKSGVNKITIDDLFIQYRGGKIVLFSKKLGKRIIPRLTCAHNFKLSPLPVYQFLCDLQNQSKRFYSGIYYGPWSDGLTFLPRIRYKNLIIKKARWNYNKVDIQPLIKIIGNQNFKDEARSWMKRNTMFCRYVNLVEGDNKLLLDLENIEMVKLLLESVKTKSRFVLEEAILNPDTSVLKDKEGNFYANEVIVSFHQKAKL